mmetsp:Transcript_14841/g.37706  ORF Transcript_14841/g.37706 Transcript_14841/m.37706 type:complete len:165 (-) Transcript_14841:92-586(-)
MVRCFCIVPSSIEAIWKVLHESLEQRKEWDDTLESLDMIEDYTGKEGIPCELAVVRTRYTAPMGVTNREFVALRSYHILEDGAVRVLCTTSVNHAGCRLNSGYVRGSAPLNGFVLKAQPDGTTQVCTVAQVDPRGMIPAFVVNLFKKKTADRMLSLCARAKRYE